MFQVLQSVRCCCPCSLGTGRNQGTAAQGLAPQSQLLQSAELGFERVSYLDGNCAGNDVPVGTNDQMTALMGWGKWVSADRIQARQL